MTDKIGEALEDVSHNLESELDGSTKAGLGASIHFDERAFDVAEEQFEFYREGTFPGSQIFHHFDERRGNMRNPEEKGIRTNEDGEWIYSDQLENGVGECLEMAVLGKMWFDEHTDAEATYLVNGSLPDTDDIYFKEPPHAFLINQNADGEYMLSDFARIVGEDPITGQIEAVNEDEGYTLQLEEDTQSYVENQGFKYSLL